MPFLAIATDYDGTLARNGEANANALEVLLRWRAATGGKLLLVTGREQKDLQRVFPQWGLFDSVVAENGAVLQIPATGEEKRLGAPPPASLIARLQQKKVKPLAIGKCIVATVDPHEAAVRQAIRDLHLEWHVVRNREAIMAVAKQVDKGSGLMAALSALGLAPESVMGIGDAENDLAFFKLCGCSVAVANAVAPVKRYADWVAEGAYGAGVVEAVHSLFSPLSTAGLHLHDLPD